MDYLQEVQNISRDCIPKGDLHMHTTWTDGKHSSTEMYDNAVKAGLEYILFSEHARKTSGFWILLLKLDHYQIIHVKPWSVSRQKLMTLKGISIV